MPAAVLLCLLAAGILCGADTGILDLDAADDALQQGEFARAREIYLAVGLLTTDPDTAARAAEQAAWCESLLGRHAAAAERIERLLEDLPGNGLRRIRLLTLLGEIRLDQARTTDDPLVAEEALTRAGEAFRRALDSRTDGEIPAAVRNRLLFNLAQSLFYRERFEEAQTILAEISAALDAAPSGGDLAGRVGMLSALCRIQEKLAAGAEAASIDPEIADFIEQVRRLPDRLTASESALMLAGILARNGMGSAALRCAEIVEPREALQAYVAEEEKRLEKRIREADAAGVATTELRRELQRLRSRGDRLRQGRDPGTEADLLAAETLVRLGRPEEAADRFRGLLDREDLPDRARARIIRGLTAACATARDPVAALGILESVRPLLGPRDSSELAFAVAQAALTAERLSFAAQCLEFCRELDPEGPRSALASYQEGSVRLRLDDPAEAVRLLEEFLDRPRETIDAEKRIGALYRLGCAYARLGRFEEAAESISRALEEDAGREPRVLPPKTSLHLARIEIAAGEPSKALEQIDRFLNGGEESEEEERIAREIRVDALEALGRYGEAARAWEDLVPRMNEEVTAAAALWRAAIDYEKAESETDMLRCLESLAASEAKTPHRRAARLKLLRRAIRSSNLDRAEELLRETPAADGKDLVELGDAWRRRAAEGDGDPEAIRRAEAAYERVSIEYPESAAAAEALFKLAECLEDRGETDAARRARARLRRDYPGTAWARKLSAGPAPGTN